MSKTLCIVQARLDSSRLPRKILADICGRPVIQHVLERAWQIRTIDAVVLAVPKQDWLTIYSVVPGPTFVFFPPDGITDNNVLGRFYSVLQMPQYHDANTIVRLTADCVLLDPLICEQVLALYRSDPECEYASNVHPHYRDGDDCECFSREALERAHREATDLFDLEHVTPWMRRHVKCLTLPPVSLEPKRKTSIDTEEDLAYVRSVLEARCLT